MIDPAAAELLESPCALIVGTTDDENVPDATRGWGVAVLDDRTVRVLLAREAAATLANLASNGKFALTATHFETLVSVQLKGRARTVEPATPDDGLRFTRFCDGCMRTLDELGQASPELSQRMMPGGVVAAIIDVDEVFDQTPGPSAGVRLAPTEAAR